MQVTQEKRPGSKMGFSITLPADQVQKTYEKTLRQLVKTTQIQGFRKGKAPRHIVMGYLGKERVRAFVLEELINTTIQDVIKESELQTLGEFSFDDGIDSLFERFDPTTEFSFGGEIEVQPDVKLGQYKELEVKVTRKDADPDQVSQTLERYRNQRSTLIPVENRAAQLADVAILDFEGKRAEDGAAIEGASGTDFQLDLDESKFIPGFISGIVGMSIGETREVSATFPEDYPNEEAAGKEAIFTITLKELKEKELPALDDAFAKDISEFETLAELEASLSKRYIDQARNESFEALNLALIDAIVANIEVELPETLIEREIRTSIAETLQSLSGEGLDVRGILQNEEVIAGLKERARPEAMENLTRTLTLAEIIKAEQIGVGQTELEMKVRDFYATYPYEDKPDPQRVVQFMREEVLKSKAFVWLRDNNTIIWVDADGNPVEEPEGMLGALEVDAVEASDDDLVASDAVVEVVAEDA